MITFTINEATGRFRRAYRGLAWDALKTDRYAVSVSHFSETYFQAFMRGLHDGFEQFGATVNAVYIPVWKGSDKMCLDMNRTTFSFQTETDIIRFVLEWADSYQDDDGEDLFETYGYEED